MSAKHPNFLFIITDQHRADHLGCYGNDIVKTPNMDSLAEKGLTFDKFYGAHDSRSQGFYMHMALAYGIGLVTYAWCSKYSKFQRWSSAAILTAVPLVIMLGRKGEDHLLWETRPKTLQEKLEFYPLTRRALERAIKDYDSESSS